MKDKTKIAIGVGIGLILILALLISLSMNKEQTAQTKPVVLIFKLKGNYSENYLGVVGNQSEETFEANLYGFFGESCKTKTTDNWVCVGDDETKEESCYCQGNPDADEGSCKSSEEIICSNLTYEGKLEISGGIKKISENYYAVIVPSEKAIVYNSVILKKGIDEKLRNSETTQTNWLSKQEFENYVVESNPFEEAYFYIGEKENLTSVTLDLEQGNTPENCEQII
jgi:hypothetical protein